MIIGIAGVSRSGKTTLAISLKEKLGNAEIISLDDYPAKIENFKYIKDVIDWEHPSSLDFVKIIDVVREAATKNEIIIVEGIFLFHHETLKSLIDKFIYLDLEKEDFLKRKLHDNRWGHIPNWYREHIWQSHLLFGVKPVGVEAFEINANSGFSFSELQDYLEK
ncbi:uridine kinase family protein [Fulvivirga lutimaris]|uniref:uridine kinase family protein n=1 Tax=Fulvivirga lutimaris TaxID=1819566 RepID=UPI0012BD1B66|nr:hypothetical protein [Fulvivirga lutimaris]MTI41045.1 hypothetical protein [Fulvivirga lutimaris]